MPRAQNARESLRNCAPTPLQRRGGRDRPCLQAFHETHRQRWIEQEREIELDQKIKPNLACMSDGLGELE